MEQWKEIVNFEGIYEVSSLGRVRRIHKDNRSSKYKVLSQDTLRRYKKVTLFKNGIGYKKQVHRLVAEAFIPNPLNLEQVNHKDENPSNNNVDNLEWCSRIYNVNYGTGIDRQVTKRSKKVLQFDLDENIINEFNSTQEASRILGISQGLISNCCNGGYWRNNHSKFIKCNRVGEFKFKFKEDEVNKS